MLNNRLDRVEDRFDRLDEKLDRYTIQSTKALTCIKNHMENKAVHFSKDEIIIKSEPKITGKLIVFMGTVITLLTVVINGVFRVIGI